MSAVNHPLNSGCLPVVAFQPPKTDDLRKKIIEHVQTFFSSKLPQFNYTSSALTRWSAGSDEKLVQQWKATVSFESASLILAKGFCLEQKTHKNRIGVGRTINKIFSLIVAGDDLNGLKVEEELSLKRKDFEGFLQSILAYVQAKIQAIGTVLFYFICYIGPIIAPIILDHIIKIAMLSSILASTAFFILGAAAVLGLYLSINAICIKCNFIRNCSMKSKYSDCLIMNDFKPIYNELRGLQGLVSVTATEFQKIIDDVKKKYPKQDSEEIRKEIEQEIHQDLIRLIDLKIALFLRRSGWKSLINVLQESERLINRIENPSQDISGEVKLACDNVTQEMEASGEKDQNLSGVCANLSEKMNESSRVNKDILEAAEFEKSVYLKEIKGSVFSVVVELFRTIHTETKHKIFIDVLIFLSCLFSLGSLIALFLLTSGLFYLVFFTVSFAISLVSMGYNYFKLPVIPSEKLFNPRELKFPVLIE